MASKNKVTLKGTIAKIAKAEKVTILTLGVKDPDYKTSVSNYPTVYFFGETKDQLKDMNEGDRVCIGGRLQSYDSKKLRKGQSEILIVGETAELEAPKTGELKEFGEPMDDAFAQDENSFEVQGQILGIEAFGPNVYLTIRVSDGSRHTNIIKFSYIARNAALFLKNVYVLQHVHAMGNVQTLNVPVESPEDVKGPELIRDSDKRERRLKTHKQQLYVLYDVYDISK